MRFAGRVADKKNTVESTPPDAGPNQPGGQPVTLQPGTRKSLARGATRLFDMREYGLAGFYWPCRAPRALQLVPADAAGQADTSVVAVDHPAVSSRKSQEWHQSRWQSAVQKMRFETKQIKWPRCWACQLRGQGAGFPRAVSGDHDSRSQLPGLTSLLAYRNKTSLASPRFINGYHFGERQMYTPRREGDAPPPASPADGSAG
jgi:hypothetical protein